MTEAGALTCEECGREQAEAERRWCAYLTVDDEAVVYCPACAEREFGSERRTPPDARR